MADGVIIMDDNGGTRDGHGKLDASGPVQLRMLDHNQKPVDIRELKQKEPHTETKKLKLVSVTKDGVAVTGTPTAISDLMVFALATDGHRIEFEVVKSGVFEFTLTSSDQLLDDFNIEEGLQTIFDAVITDVKINGTPTSIGPNHKKVEVKVTF